MKVIKNKQGVIKLMWTLGRQIIKFVIVGMLAFLIDYGIMVVLMDIFSVYYLFASTISFFISVIFNYICSMKFVFLGNKNGSKKKEFILFIVLSVLGLMINQIAMFVFVEKLSIIVKISKIFATGIVMIWNFVTRKILIEK